MTDAGKTIHIRPRYYRLYTDPGVELAEENYRYRELGWDVPLGEIALVLVDVWNNHFSRDTLERIEQVTVENVVPVVEACRSGGMTVIHAPAWPVAGKSPNLLNLVPANEKARSTYPNTPDWPPEEFRRKRGPYARYARPPEPQDEERVRLRAEYRDFHPLVKPVGEEPVVPSGEALHRLCARQGILHLVYVGFNTNACIIRRDYGVYNMGDRGYTIILLRDCTTGMETHETRDGLVCTRGTIATLEQFGNYTMTGQQLIDALR